MSYVLSNYQQPVTASDLTCVSRLSHVNAAQGSAARNSLISSLKQPPGAYAECQ